MTQDDASEVGQRLARKVGNLDKRLLPVDWAGYFRCRMSASAYWQRKTGIMGQRVGGLMLGPE